MDNMNMRQTRNTQNSFFIISKRSYAFGASSLLSAINAGIEGKDVLKAQEHYHVCPACSSYSYSYFPPVSVLIVQ